MKKGIIYFFIGLSLLVWLVEMIIAVSLVVAGVMTYLMFSGLDEDFYHFPWKVFAGFGIMSWLVREGLKLVRDVKKEFEE